VALAVGLNTAQEEVIQINKYIKKMDEKVRSLGLKFNEAKTTGLVIAHKRKEKSINC
jgi:hypothetical protein